MKHAYVDDKRVEFLKVRLKRSGPVGNLTVGKGKGEAFPLQGLDSPLEFQEVKAPEFLDNWHMNLTVGGR